MKLKETLVLNYVILQMSKEKRIVYSKRLASREAISLLWADNSEDEVEGLDDEDADFISNDMGEGADETIIGGETFYMR